MLKRNSKVEDICLYFNGKSFDKGDITRTINSGRIKKDSKQKFLIINMLTTKKQLSK